MMAVVTLVPLLMSEMMASATHSAPPLQPDQLEEVAPMALQNCAIHQARHSSPTCGLPACHPISLSVAY